MPEIKYLKRMTTQPRLDTNIYRLQIPKINEKSIVEEAKRLNLTGNIKTAEVLKNPKELSYTEGPYVVTLYQKSGALRFYDSTRWQMDDGTSHVTMSDDDAVEIAEKFIKKTQLVPMAECKLFKVTHLHVGVQERDSNKAEERIIDTGVIFQRTLDKTPVEGPGGKVIVYIDSQGDVTGCDRIWRDLSVVYRKVPSNQLRPTRYAELNLAGYWRRADVKRIDVKETRFGYFEAGRSESQRYLQPTFIMPITLMSADERIVMKSVHVVPAAQRPVGSIMPRLKVVPEEPPREE
ncbi:hypothetical protein EH223_16005 [candidate division KSB1 bacterium]|nr:hypothetical protein [candidate division KSB1 bacterium]RQW01199.1 MAG: hypothetical protein EH223_16005 [candidate division KSB1 bacterium]